MKRIYTLLISTLFCYLTLTSQAQTPIDSLQKVLKNVNTDNDRLSVLEKIYNYYRPINMDSAQITVHTALGIAQKTKNAKAEARFLTKLGILYRMNKSDYKTSLETYLKALKIAESNKNVQFFKMNTDDCGDIAGNMRIMSIPCLIFMNNGKEVDRLVGFNAESKIVDWLDQCAK